MSIIHQINYCIWKTISILKRVCFSFNFKYTFVSRVPRYAICIKCWKISQTWRKRIKLIWPKVPLFHYILYNTNRFFETPFLPQPLIGGGSMILGKVSEWVIWQFFSHTCIVTVFACDRYYGCYKIALPHWSTVPQTTRTQIPHPVTLSWHQANQS